MTTYTIRASHWETLVERIVKLNRKAVKLGLDTIEAFITDRFDGDKDVPYIKVDIIGDAPRINGSEFVARITHTDAGNIVNFVPGSEHADLSTFARNCGPDCDHCGFKRSRKDTFIIRNESGETLQVGRTCLKDYTRSDDVSSVLRIFSLYGELEDNMQEFLGCSGGEITYSLRSFLAHTHASIQQDGWTSKGKADEYGRPATVNLVLAGYGKDWLVPEQDDYDAAEEAIEWGMALGDRDEDLNDYQHNLFVSIARGWVTLRTAGIIASTFIAMKFERDRAEDRAKTADALANKVNETLGNIKQRLTLDVTIMSTRNTMYGQAINMEDSDGRALVWFTDTYPNLDDGATVKIRGTVKRHDDFRGRKQTYLTRCVVC